jgi:hypothetical protein
VISYKELHPLSNQIFSFFIENKFPNSYHAEDTTPGGSKKRNSFTDAFGKLDIDELSIALTEEGSLKLCDRDQLKILSIVYAIIFSHFIESQIKLKSSKETIGILEDKIQELKDAVKSEATSKSTLESYIYQSATKVIQRYWRRYRQQKRSKIILMEKIEKLKILQVQEQR